MEVELSGPGNRMLRRGQQVGAGNRGGSRRGRDLVLLREERGGGLPPRRSGAVWSGVRELLVSSEFRSSNPLSFL